MDKNIVPTSDLASLDCWDYTIELECLRGPQGIIHIKHTYSGIRLTISYFMYIKQLLLRFGTFGKVMNNFKT